MCGILCTINIGIKEDNLDILNHRGPDANGIIKAAFSSHHVSLGQTRLSIQDLSDAGHQPAVSPCGNYILVFNGEIYNHQDLRLKLPDADYRSHSDTETLLHYLIHFGAQRIDELNGIFSFCFLNRKEGALAIVRDPLGVKPLYYYQNDNSFVFASEIRAIQQFVSPSIDPYFWYTSLKLRYSLSPGTIYKDVKKLEPGYRIDIDLNESTLNPCYSPFYAFNNTDLPDDPQELIFHYDYLLQKSVERQLLSDVPVSLLLSGGIDSALLLHYIKKCTDQKIEAYTIGYESHHEECEIHYAQETANHFGIKTNVLHLDETTFARCYHQLPGIVEEPLGSQSLVPFMQLMQRLHKDNFKVALSGQGVDELLGGYHRYKYQDLLGSYHIDLRLLGKLTRNDKFRRGFNALSATSQAETYLASYSFFEDKYLERLLPFSIKGYKELLLQELEDKIAKWVESPCSSSQTMMSLDLHTALNDDLLNYTDKISMHHSVEVRVPYLDLELVQFLKSVPLNLKVRRGKGKVLHKMLSSKVLPEHIVQRQKKGFFVPRNAWFKGDLNHQFVNALSRSKNTEHLLNTEVMEEMLKAHLHPKRNLEDQVFFLMNQFFLVEDLYKHPALT